MKITSTNLLRTSENHVTVTYFVTDGKSFAIDWSNIHEGTGEVMNYYDYDLEASSDDESIAELASAALKMGEDSALYCNIREIITNDDIKSHCIVDNVCVADFDESDSIDNSTITVEYSTGDKVHVQLTGGEHKEALGCLTHLNDQEHGYDECEQNNFMVSNAVGVAEKFVTEGYRELYETYALHFNVSINNTSFYLRVNNETDAAEIITEDHYCNDLSSNHKVLKKYETEGEAWEEINSYRTDEYHDFRGLNALLVAIDSEI